MEILLNIDMSGDVIKNVNLVLNTGVPIISVPDTFGSKRQNDLQKRDYAISEEEYDRTKLNSIVIPTLSVVGDTTTDRFTFVTVIASFIKKVEAYVYYDKVSKMLFMMPDPNRMEESLVVFGQVIGLRSGQALYGDVDSGSFQLPTPNVTGEPVTTLTMHSRGLENVGNDNCRTKLSDTVTVASSKIGIVEYAVLSDALSFSEDINYVTFNMIGIGTRKISTLKSGNPQDMLIPLIF